MIKKVAVLLVLVGSIWQASAQDAQIILAVGDEQVTRSEFESIFKKNNREADVSPEALEEYMELFINFKLKVKEAESLGMDTVNKFIQELAGYRNQLARPYLTDTDQSEALIRQAYERKKEEIKASHVLIGLDLNASPQDTLKAWKKINDIRKKAMAGNDFSELAKEHSTDPSAKDNGGSLGYFSALQMVYPFENAAFNTPVGEISKPVRTRFGYHILKVYDRRPSRGEIKVAHIMVRSSDTDSQERQALAEKQIQDIHEELLSGGVFADLALKYSDDGSSSEKGGQLPMFGAGKMVEEFENAAFALTQDGEISKPVRSRFGWHIIQRIEYKPLPSYEEMESELKMRIAKDTRSELTRKSFVNRLKKEYNFTAHSKNLMPVLNTLDTNIFHGKWDATKAQKLNKPLFEIDGNTFTQKNFVEFLSSGQKSKRRTSSLPIEYGTAQYEKFEEDAIFDYENSRLEEKYPEFKALMKEYHDGILLFELTDMMVWSMAVRDTSGLEEFYEKNKEKYAYKERASGVLYFCDDESIAKKARKMASKGKSQEAVRDKLNKMSNLKVRMESVKLEKGNRPYLEGVEWKKGLSDNFEHNNQVAFFHIHDILPPEPKPLSEVRGLVTAAYQNHLEKEWIKELRSNYSYSVNKDVLYSIQ